MIKKIIHYCWFGGGKEPDSVKECIASWEKYCPNYEIIKWTEDTFDITCHPYMKEAYEHKKWAFVSDLARLLIIYKYGGVYLDTDVELIKNLDSIVDNNAYFFAIERFKHLREKGDSINIATGLGFGAESGHVMVKALIDEYNGAHFIQDNGEFDCTPCPRRNSKALSRFGFNYEDKLLHIMDGTIYPSEYFCPIEFERGVSNFTSNTVSIHHYSGSWRSKEDIEKDEKLRQYISKYGNRCGRIFFSYYCTIIEDGLLGAIKLTKKYLIHLIELL